MINIEDFNVLIKFTHDVRRGFRLEIEPPLNHKETELLVLLSKVEGKPMFEYGKMVGLERGSFTYLVDLLRDKDLIIRVANKEDKRKKSLQLTEEGKEVVKEIEIQHKEYLSSRLEKFGEQDYKDLEEAIETIARLQEKLPKLPHSHRHLRGDERPPRGGRRPHRPEGMEEMHMRKMSHMHEEGPRSPEDRVKRRPSFDGDRRPPHRDEQRRLRPEEMREKRMNRMSRSQDGRPRRDIEE